MRLNRIRLSISYLSRNLAAKAGFHFAGLRSNVAALAFGQLYAMTAMLSIVIVAVVVLGVTRATIDWLL